MLRKDRFSDVKFGYKSSLYLSKFFFLSVIFNFPPYHPHFLSLHTNLAKFICLLLDLCLSDAGVAAASSGSETDSDSGST